MNDPYAPHNGLASLDGVRAALASPLRRRTPLWVLLLAASFAAVAGVSAAGVMILGPSGGVSITKSVRIAR